MSLFATALKATLDSDCYKFVYSFEEMQCKARSKIYRTLLIEGNLFIFWVCPSPISCFLNILDQCIENWGGVTVQCIIPRFSSVGNCARLEVYWAIRQVFNEMLEVSLDIKRYLKIEEMVSTLLWNKIVPTLTVNGNGNLYLVFPAKEEFLL